MHDTLDGRAGSTSGGDQDQDREHELVDEYVWVDTTLTGPGEWIAGRLLAGVVRDVQDDVVVIEPFDAAGERTAVSRDDVEPLAPGREDES